MVRPYRVRPDGSVLVIRPSREVTAELNRTHWRGQSDVWYPVKGKLAVELRPGPKVVVYAKGPSLDKFQHGFDAFGLPSFGINEAAIVKKTDYAIALDHNVFANFRGKLDPKTTVIAQAGNHYADDFPNQVWFRWGLDATPGFETAPVLFELLAKMGVREVLAVGFDAYPSGQAGMNLYASSVKSVGAHPRSDGDYAPINRHLDQAILQSGLVVHWWRQPLPPK